ncbi:hypothetical protein HYALB_00005866 [Hymenoscyphus albidus]|uniref:Uncharacterized protein n=1 Tax=Hymenoscyphus albidus TaxID=595503 RepID=A0A9N9QBE1_9HELO|nr:hypothetical protein HYALB_00005866 [Hymenoscyphus albidus]
MLESNQKKPVRIKKVIGDFPTAQRHNNHPKGSKSWLEERRRKLVEHLKELYKIHEKHEKECENGTGGGVERYFKEHCLIDEKLREFPKYSIEKEGGRKKMQTVRGELWRELQDIERRLKGKGELNK